MAKFLETSLTLAEFKEMVKESKGVDVDVNLATIADERLYSKTEDCPTFYYLKDIGDKDYMVEQNGNTAIISEVVEIYEDMEFACGEYLKQKFMKCYSEELCQLVHNFALPSKTP